MTTVRLACMRRFPEAIVSGLLLGIAAIPVLEYSGADFAGWLLGAACVVALAATVPYAYWLRARPSVARRLRPGPGLGRLDVTSEHLPPRTPPRAAADLFALFADRGVPINEHGYVNAVLAAHGRPRLPASTK